MWNPNALLKFRSRPKNPFLSHQIKIAGQAETIYSDTLPASHPGFLLTRSTSATRIPQPAPIQPQSWIPASLCLPGCPGHHLSAQLGKCSTTPCCGSHSPVSAPPGCWNHPLCCGFTSAAGNSRCCVSPGFVPRLSHEFESHLFSLFFFVT